jgi:hypothetical protein
MKRDAMGYHSRRNTDGLEVLRRIRHLEVQEVEMTP